MLILNCSRQWGKSTVTAVKAVHQAVSRADSLTLVASPTERQSAEFVRKAAAFVRRLGMRARGDGDNAISLAFPNGNALAKRGQARSFRRAANSVFFRGVEGGENPSLSPFRRTGDYCPTGVIQELLLYG